jgi:hypothetical protein
MPCHLALLKNISENSRSMQHHLMLCHLSPLKNSSKNSRQLPHATSPFLLKNNSKNSRNHLMPHHLSLLKKFNDHATSPHVTSYFSIEK